MQDHNGNIELEVLFEEFAKYDGHALSSKAVDRIFNQIPREFKSWS